MLIKIFILTAMLIMAIPDDAKALDRPYPTELIYEGEITLKWNTEHMVQYLRPGYTIADLPDAAIGKVYCYSDGYGSARLLDSYQDIWNKLTTAGKFGLNKDMVTLGEMICDKVREELYGPPFDRESPPSWNF